MESRTSTYFSSHDIRASAATMDSISGHPDKQVADHCGHTNEESVKPYLKHLNDNKLSITTKQAYLSQKSLPVYKPSFEKWSWPKQLTSENDMKKFYGLQKGKFKKNVQANNNYYQKVFKMTNEQIMKREWSESLDAICEMSATVLPNKRGRPCKKKPVENKRRKVK